MDPDGNELEGFLESRIKQSEAYRNLVNKYGADSDSISLMLNVKKPMTIFTWNGERDTLFSSMDSLNYYKRFLHAGFMSMNPQTGAVKGLGRRDQFQIFQVRSRTTRNPATRFYL